MEGWGCCSSSFPRDTNSASLLFPQGRGRPAGSRSAAWFQTRRTWPCHRWLSPMITARLVPAMLASSSFIKKYNYLQKKNQKRTGLSVELVTGCWGGRGYKRIWREMRDIFISADFSGCSPGWSGGNLKEVWLQEECSGRDHSMLCPLVFFLNFQLLPTVTTRTSGYVDLWPNLAAPLFSLICFWNKNCVFLNSLVVIVIKMWEKPVPGNCTDLTVLSMAV